jgi:hypothetical protein
MGHAVRDRDEACDLPLFGFLDEFEGDGDKTVTVSGAGKKREFG